MISSQQKAHLMRVAEKKPGAAYILMLGLLQDEMEQRLGTKLSEIEARLPETVVLKHIEKLRGEPGPGADKDAVVKEVLKMIRIPSDGHTPTRDELLSMIVPLIPRVKDGHTPTSEEIIKIMKPLIPEVKDGRTPTRDELKSIIEPLVPKKDDFLGLIKSLVPDRQTLIDLITTLIPRIRKGKKDTYLHGSGGGGGLVKAYTLTGLNGSTKTFVIPKNSGIISVHCSSAPGICDETTDYTYTSVSITFTSQITAASTLASDQTVRVVYIEG